jgi:hypothetical protein
MNLQNAEKQAKSPFQIFEGASGTTRENSKQRVARIKIAILHIGVDAEIENKDYVILD